MTLSIFDDPSRQPDSSDLRMALLDNSSTWDALVDYIKQTYPQVSEKWSFSKSGGWTSRLQSKKRTIIYLIPSAGYYMIGLVYGQKATDAALGSALPEYILEIIRTARVYAEGRGFRLNVNSADMLHDIKMLIHIKMTA